MPESPQSLNRPVWRLVGVPAAPGNEYAARNGSSGARVGRDVLHLAPSVQERHEVRAVSNRPLLRRDVRGRRRASSGRQGAGPAHRDDDGRRAAAPSAVGRARAPAHGDYVQRVRRQRRHGEDLSLRSRPPDRRGRRMERDRAGPQTADPRAEPVHRRHLPRSENRQGRRHPRRDHRHGEQLPETVHRHESARRRVVPHHGDGSRPRPRRADLRAGRQPALPFGRVVRPAEPRLDEAHVSAGVRVVADSSGRRLSQPAARHAGVDGRRERRVAARRRPDPRGSQLGLLRALLPGPADGGGAGRRARPRGVGRLRLDAHDERIRAGRRDLPADRRRLPGPEDLPAPIRCWACPD